MLQIGSALLAFATGGGSDKNARPGPQTPRNHPRPKPRNVSRWSGNDENVFTGNQSV